MTAPLDLDAIQYANNNLRFTAMGMDPGLPRHFYLSEIADAVDRVDALIAEALRMRSKSESLEAEVARLKSHLRTRTDLDAK